MRMISRWSLRGSGISSTRQFLGVGHRMPGISGVCLGGTVEKDHVIMEII
jgi:hypothetical protein